MGTAGGVDATDPDLLVALQMQQDEYYYNWPGPQAPAGEPYVPMPNQEAVKGSSSNTNEATTTPA
eukprot:4713539-Pyramimonas_sp.AAC.1